MLFKLSLNRLATTATAAALTFVGAFVAQPTQKASAQQFVLFGSGSTAVEPLIEEWFTSRGASYNPNDDDEGREEFNEGLTDFVSTDFFPPNVPGQVVTNPIDSTIALPYNVPGFQARFSVAQACGIVDGTITNWNQVGGPDLLIRRVFRSETSSDTAAFNSAFVLPFCGFNLSTSEGEITVPNPRDNDIAASSNPDVVKAVIENPGAIGYVEEFVARAAGFNNNSFAFFSDPVSGFPSGFSIAIGPNYVVFRGSYDTEEKAVAARSLCRYIATEGSTFAQQQFGYAAPSDPRPASDCDAIAGP